MPTLRSSGASPYVEDYVGRALGPRNADVTQVLAEELALWKAFEGTRQGQIVAQLADPFIVHFSTLLGYGIDELRQRYPHLTTADIAEMRAEWRGELRWWKNVRMRPRYLDEMLTLIQKRQEKEEKARKGKGSAGVPEAVKKYV